MCGICGIITKDDSLVDQNVLDEMTDVLRHRGPDGRDTHRWGSIGFGHRRLAIIDLDHGQQPMSNADETVWINYNGEVYNYVELRSDLIQRGYTFETRTDTEVVLHLYEEHGLDMFEHLNGMFAFAIYDQDRGRIVLGRDRFGQKPLYVYEDDEVVLFGSEIKALLQHPQVTAEPDPRGVQEYLTFQHCLGDRTMFKNVRHVEPACYLVLDEEGNRLEEDRYWWFDLDEAYEKSEEECIDELRFVLEDAIKIRLRSDVPIGSYLSGGVDSSTVSSMASRLMDQGLPAFTGYFEEEGFSELEYAESVADQNDSPHHTVCPDAEDFAENLQRIIYHMDEPAAGPGSFPQLMVSQLASEHVKVVLGGIGGDELFGGYARYLILYLEACIKGSIYQTQDPGSHLVTLENVISNLAMLQDYTPLIREFWRDGLFERSEKRYFDLMKRFPDLNKFFTEDFLEDRDEDEIYASFEEEFNEILDHTPEGHTSLFNRMTAYDTKTMLRSLLHVEDRMSMACSIESRLPMLDHRIAELAYRIPARYKYGDGKAKAALIKAASSFLPEDVLEREDKMGFPVPYVSWLQGPLRKFAEGILLGEEARSRGIYNMEGIEELLESERPNGRELWGLLCLELWFQTFIEDDRSATEAV